MNLEPFCELCKATEGKDKRWAAAFCDTLNGIFDDNRFNDLGKVCHLFYGKGNGLSKAQFYRKRKYIVSLYGWLHEHGYVSKEFFDIVSNLKIDDVMSEEELSKYYFKSLDSVISYIKIVGNRFGMGADDDLLLIKSIVALAWKQVDTKEMVQIRKSDLHLDTMSVDIRGNNARTIYFDSNSFDVLNKLKNSDSYLSFPSGTSRQYKYSTYLFRSDRADAMNENSIKGVLKRFNASVEIGQFINLLPIRKNGIFYETLVQTSKSDESVNTIIQKMIKCDKPMAFGYAKLYHKWKEKYYGKE